MIRCRLMLVFAAVVASAGAACAQDVLQVIPEDAIGFVVVNRVGATNEKMVAVAKKLKLDMPASPLEMLKGAAGAEKGIAETGSIAVAAFANQVEADEPLSLFFVPVSNYQEFIKQFEPDDASAAIATIKLKDGKELVAAKRGSFAILAPVADRALLERALKSEKSVEGAVGPLAAWATQNDAAGVLTSKGVKLVGAQVRRGLDDAKQQLQNLPPEAQAVGKVFDTLDAFIRSVESDVSHAGVGFKLDAAGNFQVSAQARFVKDSGFAKAGTAIAAPPGGALAGLPATPFVLAVGGVLPDKAMAAMLSMNTEMMKAAGQEVSAETLKKIEKVYADTMKGMRGMSLVWQVGKEGQPAFAGLISAILTDDAAAYLVNYEKAIIAMNELSKELNLPFLPAYEMKKVQLDGKAALEMSMDLGAFQGVPEEMQAMLKNMFGADGKLTVSLAARDDKTVLMRYTGVSGLKELLEAKANLASDAGIVQVNKALPAGAQWGLYLSPAGVTEFAGRMVKAFSPIPLDIPRFPATPPVAMAAKISAQDFELRVVVPAQVIDAAGAYVDQIKKMLNPVQ